MKLEKVLTYQKGRSPQKDFVSDNLILYLTPEYLRGNASPNFISDFPSKVSVEDGDLLLLWDGSNAGEFFKGRKGFLSSTMVKFRFNEDEYQREFLFYQLKAFEGYLKSQTNGSGIPHVDRELLLGIEVEKFDKPEQTRIAQILSKADAAIAQTEALIAKYQRIKTGLMQDLLTSGIDEHGNTRSEQTHRFKTEKGLRVPEEWEVSIIGTYLEGIEQGWSPDCEGEPAPTGEWGVLKTTSVTWEGFNENENKKLPENLFPKKQYEIKDGDVLMTRGGPNSRVGVVAFVKETRSNLILCDKIYRLIPKVKLLPEYLAIALSSSTTQRHLSNLKTGMAESQTNISQKIVESLSILVPSPIEQERIIDKLNGIDKMLKQNQRSLNKLQSLKTGLMQDLLSGKVRVNIKAEALVNS
jgi:type I restriction enzyme, S subunit